MTTIARYEIAVTTHQAEELTLESLAKSTGIHPALVEQFVALGIVEPTGRHGTTLLFDASAIIRLRTVCRLRTTLGVNCCGAAVILDLLDKLRALKREIQTLRIRSGQV